MTTANGNDGATPQTPAGAAKKLRVEVWADLICPWCGLGDRRLEMALARFEHAADVEVVHRSFQLDERAPEGVTRTVTEMLRGKLGLSTAQIDGMTKRVEDLARADGLTPYIVRENRVGNTSLAHELAAFAAEHGKAGEAWKHLYRAYFGEARSIFDIDSLAQIASEIGLSADAARQALISRRHAEQVAEDGREARALGSSGVPFFVIDRRYAVSGAQPPEALLQALASAWEDHASGAPRPTAG